MVAKMPLLIKLILLLILATTMLWINHRYVHATPHSIRDWMLSFGWIAPLVFVILYTVRPLVLFPASILSLAGGLSFGVFWGTVYTAVGATLGAILAFLISRYFGKNLVKKRWTGKWNKVEKKLEEQGFLFIFIARLIPIVSFDLVSYAAGLSKIRLLPYVFGTFIGMMPATFAYNYLGSSFTTGSTKAVLIALSVFAFVLAVSLLFKNKCQLSKNDANQ